MTPTPACRLLLLAALALFLAVLLPGALSADTTKPQVRACVSFRGGLGDERAARRTPLARPTYTQPTHQPTNYPTRGTRAW